MSMGAYLFFFMVLGIVITAASFFMKKGVIKNSEYYEGYDTKNVSDSLYKSVEDAESAANELEEYSKFVLDEFEGKYQELLFLYQLIDEKKKELQTSMNQSKSLTDTRSSDNNTEYADAKSANDSDIEKTYETVKYEIEKRLSHIKPKAAEIERLMLEGNSLKDIAKKLGMGVDEINLIMSLVRAGQAQ